MGLHIIYHFSSLWLDVIEVSHNVLEVVYGSLLSDGVSCYISDVAVHVLGIQWKIND